MQKVSRVHAQTHRSEPLERMELALLYVMIFHICIVYRRIVRVYMFRCFVCSTAIACAFGMSTNTQAKCTHIQ